MQAPNGRPHSALSDPFSQRRANGGWNPLHIVDSAYTVRYDLRRVQGSTARGTWFRAMLPRGHLMGAHAAVEWLASSHSKMGLWNWHGLCIMRPEVRDSARRLE